jgi:hypothetical protein
LAWELSETNRVGDCGTALWVRLLAVPLLATDDDGVRDPAAERVTMVARNRGREDDKWHYDGIGEDVGLENGRGMGRNDSNGSDCPVLFEFACIRCSRRLSSWRIRGETRPNSKPWALCDPCPRLRTIYYV